MKKGKLKIGLLMDDIKVPKWVFDIILNISNSDYGQISLIVKNISNNKKLTFISRIKRLLRNRKNILYFFYQKLENYFYPVKDSIFKSYNIKEYIDCDIIYVDPIATKFSDRFHENDIKKINEYDIDVFLRFGFRILRGQVLKNISNCGIWSFHHADYKVNRGGPAGFWEYLKGIGYTGITLQILNEELDNGYILDQSFSCTNSTSVNLNRLNYYSRSLAIIERNLKSLNKNGKVSFLNSKSELNKHSLFYSERLYVNPTNLEFLILFLKKLVKKIFNKLYSNQWILMYKFSKNKKFSKTFYQFKKIIPPKDRFWADPFILFKNNNYFIFFEELKYSENKGKISFLEINEKGDISKSQTAIEESYHLSYPFIFESENKFYIIPESAENKSVDLYECVNFPKKWVKKCTILNNIQAVDSTIFKHNGKFWLFCCVKNYYDNEFNEDLHLFFSEKIDGNWTSHPKNPIISDVRYARPAGGIYIENDKIYRPSQNGANSYGYGIQINEIIKISETEYEEINIQSIKPNWHKNILGLHTINFKENLTIIDAIRKKPRFKLF
tara:strand:- start:2781 stop:4448 length:1668 start_codon:yes stop_codon:yes gene_type:complete